MSSAELHSDASVSLRRDHNFVHLFAGQACSQFGTQTVLIVLPLVAVLSAGVDVTALGVLRALQQLPVLMFALPLGAWLDRRPARPFMIAADVVRALVLVGVCAAAVTGVLDLAILGAAAFGLGVATVAFDLAYQVTVPRLVATVRLSAATSALESTRSVAQIGGATLGGTLVSVVHPSTALAAGAVLYGVSTCCLKGIRRTERISVVHDGAGDRGVRAGVVALLGDRSLRSIAAASAAFQFFFAAVMTVLLPHLARTLHLSGFAVGAALAAFGPGALLGAAMATRLPRRFGYGTVVVTGAALGDIAMLAVPIASGHGATTVLFVAGLLFMFAALGQTVDVSLFAVRLALSPAALRGRIAAGITFIGMGAAPLGSLTGGLLGSVLGTRAALALAAAGLLVSPVVMLASPLRHLGRQLPPTLAGDAHPPGRER